MARLDERSYDIETPYVMYRRNRVPVRKDAVPEEAVPTARRSADHQQDPVEMVPQAMPNADNRPSEECVVLRKFVPASNPPKYLVECFSQRNDTIYTHSLTEIRGSPFFDNTAIQPRAVWSTGLF